MVATEDILAVTQNVMSTMLQCDVEASKDEGALDCPQCITGYVQIRGEWRGTIIFQTTEEFASRAASKLMLVDAAHVSPADRKDTIAELTNMIGGNIKSIVASPSVLSIPTVTTGDEFDFEGIGASKVQTVPLQCDGEQFRVTVCQGIGSE